MQKKTKLRKELEKLNFDKKNFDKHYSQEEDWTSKEGWIKVGSKKDEEAGVRKIKNIAKKKPRKMKLLYKKCPHCRGKGKIRVDSLGFTKEENKREVEFYANLYGKDPM